MRNLAAVILVGLLGASCSKDDRQCSGDSCATQLRLYVASAGSEALRSCSIAMTLPSGTQWRPGSETRAALERRGTTAALAVVHLTGDVLPALLGTFDVPTRHGRGATVDEVHCYDVTGQEFTGAGAFMHEVQQ